MKKRCFRFAFILFLLVAMASCVQREIPVLGQLPGFQLTDQRNQSVTLNNLKGQVWVANFIFTSCAHTCPLLTQRMKHVQIRIQEWKDKDPALPVRIVSFSVDPERDSPEVLAEYAKRYGADPGIWYFLTGPADRIQATVVQGFKIAMGKVPQGVPAEPTGPGETFDVIHGEKFVLVDGSGRIRGYYASENSQDIRRLLNDLHTLLKSSSS